MPRVRSGLSGSTHGVVREEGDEFVTVGVGGEIAGSEFITKSGEKDVNGGLESATDDGDVSEKTTVFRADVGGNLGLRGFGELPVRV